MSHPPVRYVFDSPVAIAGRTHRLSEFDTFDEWTWAQYQFSLTAFLNHMRDRLSVVRHGQLKQLHEELRQIIRKARVWEGYDYGHGYFYQGHQRLGITGRRSTADRLGTFPIADYIHQKRCLDIGCNTGFISLSLSSKAASLTGFDFNPYLVEIANACRNFLKIDNCFFEACSFQEYNTEIPFDVVISLSNHIAYDGKLAPTFSDYISKCLSLLEPNGVLVFESHTPKFERRFDNIRRELDILNDHFTPIFTNTSSSSNYLDHHRLKYIGRRK